MRAKALICEERQTFSYTDVILPDTGPPYPICAGYQGVGIIEEVGEQVDRFKVGDKVYYRDNHRIKLSDGRC